jgi:hypothetical protein
VQWTPARRLELERDPTYDDDPIRFEQPVEWLLDAPA